MWKVLLAAFGLVGCGVQPGPAAAVAPVDMASVRIIDGSTFTLDGETIRLANVEVPAVGMAAECWAEARLGTEATFALQMQALDWTARPPKIERLGTDGEGRTLARVQAGSGDVGAVLVASGHAVPASAEPFAWCDGVSKNEPGATLIASAPAPVPSIVAEAGMNQ